MIRDRQVEADARQIAAEVWPRLACLKPMPAIESKHGGHSATYYPTDHTVRVRSNVWRTLDLGTKRLLMIHELWHARGNHHATRFLSSFDLVSLDIYRRIWGEDEAWAEMLRLVRAVVDVAIREVA